MNFFIFFDSLFLETLRAVLFHTTAIHYHHGMDFDDTSFFVLGSVTGLPQIPSYRQPEKFEKWTTELNCHKETTQDEDFLAKI